MVDELQVPDDLPEVTTPSDADVVIGVQDPGTAKTIVKHLWGNIRTYLMSLVRSITFDTTYTKTGAESTGTVYWNSDEECLDVVLTGGVILQDGQELFTNVKNQTGAEIANGTPVRFAGTLGASGRILIEKMIADDSILPAYTIGIVTQTIPSGDNGKVTWFGKCRKLDTGGTPYGEVWNDGDIIYISATVAGQLTNTRPARPYRAISIGAVINADDTNGVLFVRPVWGYKLTGLDDVSDAESPTSGHIIIRDGNLWKFSSIFTDTKDPTGWIDPGAVDAATTYNSTTRKISISGTHEYYWRGQLKSVTDYESDAHDSGYATYYLYSTDGDTFEWSTTVWPFYDAMLAIANYRSGYKFGLGEAHGTMPWQVHRELHKNLGTYKDSGGTLDPTSYTTGSTTATNRRPDVLAAYIDDEDVPHILPALTSKTYNKLSLSSTSTVNFSGLTAEIVALSGNQPYYNQYTGGAWQQTLMANNSYMCVWMLGLPVTQDSDSQAYRYVWVQGQNNPSTLAGAQALSPTDVSLGDLTSQIPETVFLVKIILQYTAANWTIHSVYNLTGSRFSQASSPAGAYLTGVTATAPLDGNGTLGLPLKIINDAGNTVTEIDTGAIANSDTMIPSSKAIYDALANKQPLDSDLTAIAGLSPSNDDIIQRKSGAWTNRTMAQLAADIKSQLKSVDVMGGHALGGTVPAGTTYYIVPFVAGLDTAGRSTAWPTAGTLKNLYLRVSSPQPATGTLVAEIYTAASASGPFTASGIKITVPAGGSGDYSDTTNSASVLAGYYVRLEITNNATSASAILGAATWQIESVTV